MIITPQRLWALLKSYVYRAIEQRMSAGANPSGSGGDTGGASDTEEIAYVVMAPNGVKTLPASRLLTVGTGVKVTDDGPGQTAEVAVDPSAEIVWTGKQTLEIGEGKRFRT